MNVNWRVATFNRAMASSCPPPNLADKRVTASSGACQKPPQSTESALTVLDCSCVSRSGPGQPIRQDVGPPRQRRIESGWCSGGSRQVGVQLNVPCAAPGRLRRWRVDGQAKGERVNVARVTMHNKAQLRRAGEMDPVKQVGEFLQAGLPDSATGGFFTAKDFPVAHLRRMGDVARQGEPGPGKVGVKIVQRPGVVCLEAQFGLNMVESERAGSLQAAR